MTPEAAHARALEILGEVCRVEAAQLGRDAHLINDLDLDSATTLDLLMTLEEELGIDIPEVEAAKLVTVGDVLDFVGREAAQGG
jgi:acyl carrier protein